MDKPALGVPNGGASVVSAEPNSAAVLTAALAEFGKLRDEISGRSTTLWTLLGLSATVSTTVAGFVLAQKADPLLLLLLPLITPCLGLLVIDHATNIGHIGRYIDTAIKPLVREAAGEQRLLSYEEWVHDWETHPVRRTLAFGLPLVLLFTLVPCYSLVYALSRLTTPWLWALWCTGLAMTAFQVGLWVAFLVPPLRRPKADAAS